MTADRLAKIAVTKEWLIRRMVAGGKARAAATAPHLLSSMPHADKYVETFKDLNSTFPEAIQRRNLRTNAGYMSGALPKEPKLGSFMEGFLGEIKMGR